MKLVAAALSVFLFGPAEAQDSAVTGTGAVLRALDKVSGQTQDIQVRSGQAANVFRLVVELAECRYPAENPTGDAYAFLVVREESSQEAVFAGWMIASSPALNALDHARYDVWVLRCMTS